uniref:Ig-like domain-containing protein n=1 Tax=Denticeps clupeoides TaxID=299321 RepID=A0AAY4AEB5_9TELE
IPVSGLPWRAEGLLSSPAVMIEEGLNVTLHCSQINTTHNSMYWYRQKHGQPLELIVYLYVNLGTVENPFKERFSAKRKTNSLAINYLAAGDSAVYFCAASYHSAENPRYPVQKLFCTPPNIENELFLYLKAIGMGGA